MVRGQGYDGASNMKGHANGLKKLVLDDCPSAYYVHCFAHQLQLTLVEVAKENSDCVWFFDQVRFLLNLIGNSCKKTRMLRVAHAQSILEALELGDIETGIKKWVWQCLETLVGDLIIKQLCMSYLCILQFGKFL